VPTYEYECEACGYEFEAFHSMSAKPLVDCPECCEPKLVKLISPGAAIIIRGTETPCHGGRGRKTQKKQQKKPCDNDRLGEGKNKSKKPFWREGPLNKDVLKNPTKYIEEGKID